MPTWTWIIIGLAAFAAVVLVAVYGLTAVRRRRVERRRAEARILRQEAEDRARRADEREALAGDIAEEAREERERARRLEQRAGKLDRPSLGRDRKHESRRRPVRRA
jgi:hypothetical protein